MENRASQLIRHVRFFDPHEPALEGVQLALIGVIEDRQSGVNRGCAEGPDEIRREFYRLYLPDQPAVIMDMGNITAGDTWSDTCYALSETCRYLIAQGIVPLVLGGSQDLTYGMYTAYEKLEQTVNLVTIDHRLDFGKGGEDTHHHNYLNRIILHKPNFLFNFSNIGHQRYLVEPELMELMANMYFDLYRLGDMQSLLHQAEPAIRNADLVSLDISAVRMGEAPGCALAGPNGFYGDEAAQLCRYAGMSDKLSAFGIFEYNPGLDRNGQTAMLLAQLLWCFVEGFSQRKQDYPAGSYAEYTKYMVNVAGEQHELTFYKSPKSDRWWMDVPYPSGQENRYERHHLVPCSYEEYQQATNDEVPDRWWKTYQKLT